MTTAATEIGLADVGEVHRDFVLNVGEASGVGAGAAQHVHVVTEADEVPREVGADEPGRAGDQHGAGAHAKYRYSRAPAASAAASVTDGSVKRVGQSVQHDTELGVARRERRAECKCLDLALGAPEAALEADQTGLVVVAGTEIEGWQPRCIANSIPAHRSMSFGRDPSATGSGALNL